MKRHTQAPRRPPLTKRRITVYTVLFLLSLITVWGLMLIRQEPVNWYESIERLFRYARIMFLQTKRPEYLAAGELIGALGISVALSILTTISGAVIAFFLAIGAARNLAPPLISQSIRSLTAVIRSVPTIIWVLVFSVTVNVGTDAAVIGMCFHSIAYLVKGFSESFEHIPRDTLDALKSCGAGITGIIAQAVIPPAAPALISWIFFRFEINFINAVAIGSAAGSGGIGYHLFIAGNLYFDIPGLGFITYTIFATAVLLEMLSLRLRKKIKTC